MRRTKIRYLHAKKNIVRKTKKQSENSKYRASNIEQCREYKKQYHTDHPEIYNTKYKCVCGIELSKKNKVRHEKSIGHLNFLSQSN